MLTLRTIQTNPATAATDPNFANVSLLLHFDGANNSTTFTDNSSNAFSMTVTGDAKISTTQSKFGGASGYFDGTGDYLTRSSTSAIDIGGGDFTIECFAYPTAKTNSVDSVLGYGNYTIMLYHNGTNWTVEMSNNGFSLQFVKSFSVTLNTWQHIAIVKSGTTVTIYKDGNSVATGTITGTVNTSGKSLYIGVNLPANAQYFTGYIDDFRLTKSVARYNANFTVPTSAYPDS